MTRLPQRELLHKLHRASAARPQFMRGWLALCGVASVCASTGLAFLLHFNLSTAGSIELLLVVLVALRFGFLQATVVSVSAVVALNYLFTPPVFKFTVADPQNWISLVTFEATALLVSGLSSKVRLSAEEAELQRRRSGKLYELSRAILLIDGRTPVTEQLSHLIRELIVVDTVSFYVVYESDPSATTSRGSSSDGSAFATYSAGVDSDDAELRASYRILRLGSTSMGALTLRGWEPDALLADAVASLAAIALERARAIQKENRAEAERNTEQLRTAVLDALAHGFKTPLTAIQTASSGLLAIEHLSTTQNELVTLIDDQATMLSQLTTRLLQTAALERREVRLRRVEVSLLTVLQNVLREQNEETRARIEIEVPAPLMAYEVDAQLIELALLQLIDNAAKYAEVGSKITIALTQSEVESCVTVENHGSAIRVEERERIFERFYRGADAAHGPSGTGVGLSIVKKTAEAHGGRAWVECDLGITRFKFTMQHYRKTRHG